MFGGANKNHTYITVVVAHIRTKTTESNHFRYFPYPVQLKDEVEKQLQELLEENIIQPSRSPMPHDKRSTEWL